jgi:hypothetical protein
MPLKRLTDSSEWRFRSDRRPENGDTVTEQREEPEIAG